MKSINRVLSLIIIFLSLVATVKAQETMYIYKDGVVVGEHILAEVDSVIFYQAQQGKVVDFDGNEYPTVVIGTQTWMAENLRTTTYNDGTLISNVTDDAIWGNITVGAYCWYDNDASYKEPYGAMYNWYSIETEKLCPTGWHVPTRTELMTMVNHLGGVLVAAGKMDKVNGTNDSGFDAIYHGRRRSSGNFQNLDDSGYFWTATDNGSYSTDYQIGGMGDELLIYDDFSGKNNGYAIRCIKDK